MQTTMQDYGDGAPQPKALARFHMNAKKDSAETLKQGRDIFKEVPYIELRAPGDKTSVMNRPVRDQDKVNYRGAWQAFEAGQDAPLDGTPLDMWPALNKAQVQEFAYFQIRTIEQLAELSDSVCGQFMGAQDLKRKAHDFIRAAKSNAPLNEMRHANKMQKEQIDALKVQMAEMRAELQAVKTEKSAQV